MPQNFGTYPYVQLMSNGQLVVIPFIGGTTLNPPVPFPHAELLKHEPGTPPLWTPGDLNTSRLIVHSGRDGSLILRLVRPSGLPYARLPDILGGFDVTGDGRPDLVIRWILNASEAIVGAFDNNGRQIYRHVGSWTTHSYTVGTALPGNGLGWVGDLDGDGANDFVLGSYDASIGRYVALVLSGRTGLVLRTGIGTSAYIGWAADGCGDVDGDGVPDFVASAQRYPGASVDIFSGRTGQTIRFWDNDGGVLRSGGFDFDRDGVPDVLFLRGGPEGGILVNSSRDGAWTHRLQGCPQTGGTRRDCIHATDDSFLEVGQPQLGNPYPVFVFPEAHYGAWQSYPPSAASACTAARRRASSRTAPPAPARSPPSHRWGSAISRAAACACT